MRHLAQWIGSDERHGPLPILLLALTVVTGLVDALSYLGLGHVFVANMTGNIVFLGFAIGGAKEFSVVPSLIAIAAFLLGALFGGRLAAGFGRHRGRLLAIAVTTKVVLVAAALALALSAGSAAGPAGDGLIALLALAMGLQNAMARRVAVPDLTTTVLTLTLTGLAADSPLARGKNPNPGRRLLATAGMLIGAALGTLLQLAAGSAAVLGVVLLLLILTGVGAYRHWSSMEAWTAER